MCIGLHYYFVNEIMFEFSERMQSKITLYVSYFHLLIVIHNSLSKKLVLFICQHLHLNFHQGKDVLIHVTLFMDGPFSIVYELFQVNFDRDHVVKFIKQMTFFAVSCFWFIVIFSYLNESNLLHKPYIPRN